VLGDVDVLTGEHRVAPLGHAGLVREGEQGREQVVVEERLGHVDVQVAGEEGEPSDAAGVAGEPAAQVGPEAGREVAEPGPGLRGGRVDGGVGHRRAASSAWVTSPSISSQALMNLSTPSRISTSMTSS